MGGGRGRRDHHARQRQGTHPGSGPGRGGCRTPGGQCQALQAGYRTEEGKLSEPGDGAHGQPQAPDRDVEEGAHNCGIEMAAGAAGQLLTSGLSIHGPLVGPGSSDDLEGVGHGHDAGSQADVLGGEPLRIAPTVPALVVLLDGGRPRSQPPGKGSSDLGTLFGMAAELEPLLLRGLGRLVQDAGGHVELSHVVQQGGPAQAVAVSLGEAHLLGDEVVEGAHPLGVASSPAVVRAHGAHEGEDALGALRGLVVDPLLLGVGQLGLEIPGGARLERHREARRCPVGKGHRQAEQGGQGEETPCRAVDDHQYHRGDEGDEGKPAGHGQRTGRSLDQPAGDHGAADGGDDGDGHGQQAHGGPEEGPALPAIVGHRLLETGRSAPGSSGGLVGGGGCCGHTRLVGR